MKRVKKMRNENIPVLTHDQKPKAVKIERPEPLRVPKEFRRVERMQRNKDLDLRNDGSHKTAPKFAMYRAWEDRAIYSPRRKKFKGWERENRRYKKVS